jgi:hypothetical protein
MVERYQKVASSRVHKTMSGISLADLLLVSISYAVAKNKNIPPPPRAQSRREENVGFWARNADIQHAGVREAQIAGRWRTDGE